MDLESDLPVQSRPGVLVSVRSPAEARAAIAGGADVVDIKEPAHGPLGRSDYEQAASICRAVAGRRPITAAGGELGELTPAELNAWLTRLPIHLLKIGFADSAATDWRARLATVASAVADPARLVAAVYADWHAAETPPPGEIVAEAATHGLRWLLVDTFDKSAAGLRSVWTDEQIADFIAQTSQSRLRVVLAGRLTAADLPVVQQQRATLVGFRGAVCEGGRDGAVAVDRVRQIVEARDLIRQNAPPCLHRRPRQ